MISYALSFFAGSLTAVSPCVLPALPLIVGSAAQEHRHAPLAVAAGLVASFTLLGAFFATVGISFSIEQGSIRSVAAILMVVFGLILAIPSLQDKLQGLFEPIARIANQRLSSGKFKGLHGQFGMGCLLGAVWSPCVGPTLGAALGLASQTGGLLPATLMMALFGFGASLPLLFIAYGSRRLFLSNRQGLLEIGKAVKPALGAVLGLAGLSILIGFDKLAEASILNVLPSWWTDLVTRF